MTSGNANGVFRNRRTSAASRRDSGRPSDLFRDFDMRTAEFAPLNRFDGYLPIEDHGLIGDGTTAALVGRDGTISWLCVPRFDSVPLFSSLLDHRRGGGYTLCPEEVVESRQYYLDDCAVLVTELRCRTGLVTIKDALVLRADVDLNDDAQAARGELLRSVSVMHGCTRLSVKIHPYGLSLIHI